MNLDSAKELAASVFHESYAEARTAFLSTVPSHREYVSRFKGPNGEQLFTDATYLGRPDAENLLILISGTHGPEGYCGSALQSVFLQTELGHSLVPSTAVLLIHALNSYGFAWDRRSTAEGIDLNRNFVDFSKPLPKNHDYEALSQHFVPTEVSGPLAEAALAALDEFRETHGEKRYWEARMSGQYTTPGGLFYGGTAPTEARNILERIVGDFSVPERRNVIIVDYHTGQGRYGYGELMCEQPSGLAGYRRALNIFGPSVTSPDLGTSSSVALYGTQDEYWEGLLGARHTYVALEFGTYSSSTILRDEHWLFAQSEEVIGSACGREIRDATKRYFYPKEDEWREMVVWRSHQVHRQALAHLSKTLRSDREEK